MRPSSWISVMLSVAAILGFVASARAFDGRVRAKVTVISDKLPADKRAKMTNFAEKVQRYISSREWIEEDYVAPFTLGFQLFLEDSPTSEEDRYKCSLVASGPDIQYYDKRAVFPFQENETIAESQEFVPINGLIDFYAYLIIGNELDKYGEFKGEPYFEKAQAVMESGKFSRYATGWDWREETTQEISSENYKKFRQMKDYYFYAVWVSLKEDPVSKTRQYVIQALHRLEEVLKENKDNKAAKQFIDAHYQEIIEIFKGAEDATPLQILMRLDPDRKDLYQEQITAN